MLWENGVVGAQDGYTGRHFRDNRCRENSGIGYRQDMIGLWKGTNAVICTGGDKFDTKKFKNITEHLKILDKISFVGALGQSHGSGARRQILFVGALSLNDPN